MSDHPDCYVIVFNCFLSPGQLAAQRRRLGDLLEAAGITMQTVVVGQGKSLISSLAIEGRGRVIIIVDDNVSAPDDSPWMAEFVKTFGDLTLSRRPKIIYVTRQTTAAGAALANRHVLVCRYIQRDDKGHWVQATAAATAELHKQLSLTRTPDPVSAKEMPIVGVSSVFCDAVDALTQIMQRRYGMVSGESGVGKLYLIRAIWDRIGQGRPLIALPCGSFYKDYFVMRGFRRTGGGREAINAMRAYFREADGGMLMLHHVEQLPLGIQDDLVARLASARPGDEGMATPLAGVDDNGLLWSNVRLLATSSQPPEQLERQGRLVPDLARKLAKRHVRVPSLAERGAEDVRLLIHDIAAHLDVSSSGTPVAVPVSSQVVDRLASISLPGNVSDLTRALEHACRKAHGETIQLRHLPEPFGLRGKAYTGTLDQIIEHAQRQGILNAISQCGGDIRKAAARLGRNRPALYRLMKQLGIGPGAEDL